MSSLPLANILHHKVRSALSALGIAIGVGMLITLSGLSHGSLSEVADRWESVDADLIIYSRAWGENLTTLSGLGLSDKFAAKILAEHGDIAASAVPVFLWPVKLGGDDQMAACVDPDQWQMLVGQRKLRGRLFDPDKKFSQWITRKLLETPADPNETFDPQEPDLSAPEHNGLEMIIDSKLAHKGNWNVGDTVLAANHHWRIVGIVPAGGMTRVYLPRRTGQFLFGNGDLTKSTLIFVKLKEGIGPDAATRPLRSLGQKVVRVKDYRAMLEAKFGVMFWYVQTVNIIALIIAFLFTMTILYTMVLQRTREIAILKSCGASKAFILWQVLAESMLLTAIGTTAGIGLSFAAAWLIETFLPLRTVTITWHWIACAAAAAVTGAALSGLYPAWRATRVDMVEALTLE